MFINYIEYDAIYVYNSSPWTSFMNIKFLSSLLLFVEIPTIYYTFLRLRLIMLRL